MVHQYGRQPGWLEELWASSIVVMKINMKIQSGKTFIIAALIISTVMPFSVFAAPSAGIKPSSFFYFFDIASERISLFFTFNSEKKARKALEYADERLAEAEEVAGDKNTDAVKTAITNYESNIAFAAEKSRGIKEKEKAEALLTTISDSTSRHQEILADVLAKVPDEAKEAITKAIEASRKGHEEALQKIAELKGEIEELKQEVAELRQADSDKQSDEIEKLKKEVEKLKKQQIAPAPTPQTPSRTVEPKKESSPEPIETQKNNKEENFWELTVTLNAKFRETAREYKNVISENPHHLQNRLDELDTNIRVIRNTYFTNATGDAAVFNEMFKLLEDSYQRERDYVQNVFDNTNKRLKYFDDMIAYYDSKVNYYIKNSTKFVSMETWIADGNAFYKEGQSDKLYEVMSGGIQDFSNFVDNMKRKDDEYYKAVTLIKNSLEKYGSSYSSYTPPAPTRNYSYYDKIVDDLFSKPSILNPITCNIRNEGFGNQTVTCY